MSADVKKVTLVTLSKSNLPDGIRMSLDTEDGQTHHFQLGPQEYRHFLTLIEETKKLGTGK